jgi:predicted SnoaL-like aldol condensation-catalyzing enzyme
MKLTVALLMGAAMLVSAGSYAADAATIEKNKQTAIRFYNALAQGDIATLRELGRPDYIQHNPNFETSIEGLAKAIQARPPRPANAPPIPPLTFVRVITDGEFVVTVRRMAPVGAPPGTEPTPEAERANVDIFRLQDGKVAEHWDYMETFPRGNQPPKNSNGRF